MLQSRGIAVRKLSCENDISTYCAALHESAGVYRESSIKKTIIIPCWQKESRGQLEARKGKKR